jgi:hypothetical protein
MRGRDEDNGTSARDLPGSAGMHLAEEEIDEYRERPQD